MAGRVTERFARGKTSMPGGCTPPEQIKRDGVPARHGRVGDDALAKVDDLVAEKLGL